MGLILGLRFLTCFKAYSLASAVCSADADAPPADSGIDVVTVDSFQGGFLAGAYMRDIGVGANTATNKFYALAKNLKHMEREFLNRPEGRNTLHAARSLQSPGASEAHQTTTPAP